MLVTLNLKRHRGTTLAETCLAIFMLTASLLVIVNLFHVGLRYQTRADMQATASLVAEKALDQVRAWARQPANYDSDWSGITGSKVDADYPGFAIQVDAAPRTVELQSPCAPLEAVYSPNPRRLLQAVVPVRVEVRWGPQPVERLTLHTYIGEPVRTLHPTTPLRVTRVGGSADPVPQNGVVDFEVMGYDDNDQPLPDALYLWDVLPVSGRADLDMTGLPREGRQARLRHRTVLSNGSTGYLGGLVRVRARMIYHGQEVENLTPVVLQ